MFAENFNTAEGYGLYGGFNSVFVCDDGISVAKQVDFPNGWTDDTNLSFKVLFKNGHNCADASTPMTLNGVAVVVNKYGTLIPLPIHEMDDGGTPIYKSLQPNTILEMYYTDNYDGADTPAYVIIGNPIVLSSADYTIYADGSCGDDPIGTWKSFENDNTEHIGYFKSGTVFDATKYIELNTILGGNTVPWRFDHNRLGDVEQITPSASSFTAQYDGILIVSGYGSSALEVKINGVLWSNMFETNIPKNVLVPFNKGDVITFGSNRAPNVRYYKHPLFIKAK